MTLVILPVVLWVAIAVAVALASVGITVACLRLRRASPADVVTEAAWARGPNSCKRVPRDVRPCPDTLAVVAALSDGDGPWVLKLAGEALPIVTHHGGVK